MNKVIFYSVFFLNVLKPKKNTSPGRLKKVIMKVFKVFLNCRKRKKKCRNPRVIRITQENIRKRIK